MIVQAAIAGLVASRSCSATRSAGFFGRGQATDEATSDDGTMSTRTARLQTPPGRVRHRPSLTGSAPAAPSAHDVPSPAATHITERPPLPGGTPRASSFDVTASCCARSSPSGPTSGGVRGQSARPRLVDRRSAPRLGQDAAPEDAFDDTAAAVIRPEVVPFVSYPYEWTFGQLSDAALLTLDIQAAAIAPGLDAQGRVRLQRPVPRACDPLLIDHLSFQRLPPESPWVAYQQFCEHFLAPLALMARRDVGWAGCSATSWTASRSTSRPTLLPGRTKLRLGLGAHIHLHARSQRSPRR